ncbi:hypothetical protein KIF59_14440 [Enterobacter cloacae subsp. cloacae]|nr:hypothetical protein [Enterobacter cloacae subsp. cloacae]
MAKYLCPYNMVICASPDYLARHGTPQTPADLVDHLCLSHTVWTARKRMAVAGCGGRGALGAMPFYDATTATAYVMAARAGAGLLQPEVLVAEELASGRLVRFWSRLHPRQGRCIYCGVRIYVLLKLTEFIAHILLRLGTI